MISISLHIVHCDKILKHNTVYRLEVEYVNGDDGRIARYQQDGLHYTLLNAFGMGFFLRQFQTNVWFIKFPFIIIGNALEQKK